MSSFSTLQARLHQLVADNETATALAALNEWLKSADGADKRAWLTTVTQLSSRLNRLEQQEAQGVLTHEQVDTSRNRINVEILELLDRMAKGEAPQLSTPGRSVPWSVLGGAGLLLIAALVYWFYPRPEPILPPEEPMATMAIDTTGVATCPEFPDMEELFRVMVLPYQVIKGDPTRVHLLVSRKIDALINRYEIDAAVRNFGEVYSDVPAYPNDTRDAEDLGRNCDAQLVVWGLTDGDEEEEESITSFRFVEGGNWQFTEYRLDESLQVDTIKSLAQMSMDGSFTAKIDQALRLVFGLMAHEEGEMEKTIALLGDQPVSDKNDPELYEIQQNLLADSYQTTGRTDMAIKAYSDLLEKDPENLRASQNRGTLFYQVQEYAKAAADLDRVLAADSTNVEARVTRVATNLKLENIEVVDRDLSILQPLYEYRTQYTNAAASEDLSLSAEEREKKRIAAEKEKERIQKLREEEEQKSNRFRELLKTREIVAPDQPRAILPRERILSRPGRIFQLQPALRDT